MKLHILLDSNKELLTTENDIVLVGNNNHIIGSGRLIQVDHSSVYENKEVYTNANNWFDNNEIPCGIRNTFYDSVIERSLAVINTIDSIIKSSTIDEMVLYGGSRHIYIASKYAEGEGIKKHYKTNWFVNELIYKKFCTSTKVRWINKKPSFLFYVHHIIRYYYYIFRMLAIAIKKNRTSRIEKTNNNYFSIIDLQLQYNHIKSIFEKCQSKKCSFFTLDRVLAQSNNDIIYVPKLPVNLVLKIFFKYGKKCRGNVFPYLSLKARFLRKELNFLNVEYQLRYERLRLFLEKSIIDNQNTMVTDMTVGMDISTCHEISKNYGCKHINLQWVSMSRILYPNLELADFYYLFAYRTYELYKQYSYSYYYYLPFTNSPIERKATRDFVLTIFMQPDDYVYDYFEYFNILFPIIKEKKIEIKIIVKPHYRQNCLKELYEIVKPYSFVSVAGLKDSCEELILKSSLVVSMHSSVIFEALINNVCCVVYNPNEKYNDTVYNNDVCYPEVNYVITDASDTIPYIIDYEKYTKQYYERRNAFIKKNDCKTSVEELLC